MGHFKEISIRCISICSIPNTEKGVDLRYIPKHLLTISQTVYAEPPFRAGFLSGYAQSGRERTSFSESTVMSLEKKAQGSAEATKSKLSHDLSGCDVESTEEFHWIPIAG